MKNPVFNILLFAFGVWLLIGLLKSEPTRFTDSKLETFLGNLAAIAIALFFLYLPYRKNKIRSTRKNNPKSNS